ncbi:hypothetical protein BIV23_34965 [Streptomyces monashensis]|uniref:Uncharacterized protein n=1 Tax=Streptomyces monashensis TaxID=1678012 RepID=A0A1S2PR00_9ACTN|nr:hypothetical protein BIV23_34965 [Streptomyces monashensis]
MHEFVAWLAARGRWLSYSAGMTNTDAIHQAVLKIPASAWKLADEPDGEIGDGAWGECALTNGGGPFFSEMVGHRGPVFVAEEVANQTPLKSAGKRRRSEPA